MKTYPTYARALLRVEVLKKRGIWPGIITRHDGLFALTHDPSDTEEEQL